MSDECVSESTPWWSREMADEKGMTSTVQAPFEESVLITCLNFLRSIRTMNVVDDYVRSNLGDIEATVVEVLKKSEELTKPPVSRREFVGRVIHSDAVSKFGKGLGDFVTLWNCLHSLDDVHATSAFSGDDDWDMVGKTKSTMFHHLYRTDGRISPCSNEKYILWKAHFDGRMPPNDKLHVVHVGLKKVLVFHFRSGFLIRLDDHERMILAFRTFMKKAMATGSFDDISRYEIWRGLLGIFWPGPSAYGMTGVFQELPYPLPPFLQKRLMVAMDYTGLLWDAAASECGAGVEFFWSFPCSGSSCDQNSEENLRMDVERRRFLECVNKCLGTNIKMWLRECRYNDDDIKRVLITMM